MDSTRSAGKALPLLLYGVGGHASLVISTLVEMPEWSIAGVISEHPLTSPASVLGFPVMGDDGVLPDLLASGVHHVHVCLGDSQQRALASQLLRKMGFTLATISHASAMRSPGNLVGDGSLIQAGVLLGAESVAGEGCIFQSFVSVGHGTRMGDYVHLAGGAITGGDCVIGSHTCVGMGATLLPRLRIGQHVLVEPNTVVREDLPDYAVVEGNPARVVVIKPH